MRLRTPAAILATAVLAVGLSSVTTASAAHTSADELIYACKAKSDGAARLVTRTTKCKTTETKTWWTKQAVQAQQGIATQGPQGERGRDGKDGKDGIGTQGPVGARGPQGLPGRPGVKGDTGPAGAKGADGVDGQDGAPGQDATVGPRVMKLGNQWYTCKPVASYKGYPAEECVKGLPNGPAPTPTPTPTPTPSGTYGVTPKPVPSTTPTTAP